MVEEEPQATAKSTEESQSPRQNTEMSTSSTSQHVQDKPAATPTKVFKVVKMRRKKSMDRVPSGVISISVKQPQEVMPNDASVNSRASEAEDMRVISQTDMADQELMLKKYTVSKLVELVPEPRSNMKHPKRQYTEDVSDVDQFGIDTDSQKSTGRRH